MTATIVVKPGLQDTLTRSIARLAGTLVGAVLVTLLRAIVRPSPAVLALLVIGAVWSCSTLLRVNYAIYLVSARISRMRTIRGCSQEPFEPTNAAV